MTAARAHANGRVNLIGEHTDYNGGWVLPTAIPQKTSIVITPREDNQVFGKTTCAGFAPFRYTLGDETRRNGWVDYVQGATFLLSRQGEQLRGFDLSVDSHIPVGSGLSSSAALEVALLKALRDAFSLALTDLEVARLGQRIENEFVGAKVGIMDQMACAFAHYGEALFLDTQELRYERVPLPLDRMDLIVINSGISHRHADGGYNQRRTECEAACDALGIPSLRSLSTRELHKADHLPETLARRVRHVVTENARVLEAVRALKLGELEYLGKLFFESHQSMREDYQVSIPEIDTLVELCRAESSIYGARLTGGGFGGSIVAIAQKGFGREVACKIQAEYERRYSVKAAILVPELL